MGRYAIDEAQKILCGLVAAGSDTMEALLQTFDISICDAILVLVASRILKEPSVTISFNDTHFPNDVILHALFFYYYSFILARIF